MLLLRQILLVLLLLIQLPLPLQIPPARSIMPTDMKRAGPVLYAIQLRVLEIFFFSSAMSGSLWFSDVASANARR